MTLRRIGIGVAATMVALAAIAAVLYSFGSMETPSADVRAAYARQVAAGREPAVERTFHIPIPGCRCHSSDPVVQMSHSARRIRDCRTCHSR